MEWAGENGLGKSGDLRLRPCSLDGPLGRFFRLRRYPSLNLELCYTQPQNRQQLGWVRDQHQGGRGEPRQKLQNPNLDSSLLSFIRASNRTSRFRHQTVSCSPTPNGRWGRGSVRQRGRVGGDEEASGGWIRTSVSSCGSRGLANQQVSINGLRWQMNGWKQ